MKIDTNKPYAWVRGDLIYHAGYIKGTEGQKVWLVGKGLKGYPVHGLWVQEKELKPLDEVKNYRRHPDSLAQTEKNKLEQINKKRKSCLIASELVKIAKSIIEEKE